MFKLKLNNMKGKRPEVLTEPMTFYDLLVSGNLFRKAGMRQFVSGVTEELMGQ